MTSESAETGLVRSICRAVIRRVRQEHPAVSSRELVMHLQAARPFKSAGPELEEVWLEEVASAVELPLAGGTQTLQ